MIVPLFADELHSAAAESFVDAHGAERLAFSDWVLTELAAALAAKIRAGSMDETTRREAWDRFAGFRNSGAQWLAATPATFVRAAEFAARAEVGLRGGDALHLGLASTHGVPLCTLDKRLARAAEQVGHPVELL